MPDHRLLALRRAGLLLLALPLCAFHDGGPAFSYQGETGPLAWGRLSSAYHLCQDGREQSPIDLSPAVLFGTPEAGPLRLANATRPGGGTLINTGHTLEVRYDPGSTLSFGGITYTLENFHLHAPGEHRIGGVAYPMELHLVYKGTGGELAVLAEMLAPGADNPVVERMLDQAPPGPGEVALSPRLAAADLLPVDLRAFTYVGSLTAPPCTEGVRWIVLRQPGTVSWYQVDRFVRTFGYNARPLQPLHDRKVSAL